MTSSRALPASPLRVYKSFIIGLAIVCAATYLLELLRSDSGMVDMHQLMNAFMGCFFVTFAVPKFFNLAGFVETFKQYDIVSIKFPRYALAYPFIELILGLLLLSNVAATSAVILNSVIVLLTGVTLLGVINALRQKKQLHCACMGANFAFPLSYVAVAENSVMLLMAVSMLFASNSPHMMLSIIDLQVMR